MLKSWVQIGNEFWNGQTKWEKGKHIETVPINHWIETVRVDPAQLVKSNPDLGWNCFNIFNPNKHKLSDLFSEQQTVMNAIQTAVEKRVGLTNVKLGKYHVAKKNHFN